jgi:excinuclease ABC subunit A
MVKTITIRGARENNLKNINLDIPRNQLVVITGLSGSGKSSLAFDTIYAEGQRRYVESLSSYARQFLDKIKKPEVDHISGLAPSISIEQKNFTRNPRSTVGTVTEVYDFLRLLYAKLGIQECHKCGHQVTKQSNDEILKRLFSEFEGVPVKILAPVVRGRKGEYKKVIEGVKKRGFLKMRIDGKWTDISKVPILSKMKRHDMDIMVDHIKVTKKDRARVLNAIEMALKEGDGRLIVISSKAKQEKEHFFSSKLYCIPCGIGFSDLQPNNFSFNSPYGACPKCRGIGRISLLKQKEVIQDSSKALLKGAINEEIYFSFNKYVISELISDLDDHFSFDLSTPYGKLPDEIKDAFFWGTDDFEGLIDLLKKLYYSSSSEKIKSKVKKFLKEEVCPMCKGGRLKPEVFGVKIEGINIVELIARPMDEAEEFFKGLKFSKQKQIIASPILKELRERLRFLNNVGLQYLTLDRSVSTLAGGELQRIKLASQIGVGLTGVLYVLDEPSIGLHSRDNQKLIETLKALRDLKNTILVVEHDAETMRHADYIIDLGPGAGLKGGEIEAMGKYSEILKTNSLTADYLSGKKKIAVPEKRASAKDAPQLVLRGAKEHNLQNVDVSIPVGLFTCITGVSGSGKSTLIHDTLFKALHNKLWKTDQKVGDHDTLEGAEHFDKVIEIDQTPIGRTPRSNPATYTDLFTPIRKIFADMAEAKLRSYTQGRFSFNVKGGRCDVCQGAGAEKLEMSFLPTLFVPCDSCKGRRYNDATLEVMFKEMNIAEVLDLPVTEALKFFGAHPVIRQKLEVMESIGLGYLKLGQPSTTLSGGEAQRIKLAAELSKRSTGKTLYILDEPTTGLHFADIDNLLRALGDLRDQGNTILVIEHNLDVVKCADYIVDMGPEGGKDGGQVVVSGTPEDVIKCRQSYTGKFLKDVLK